MGQGSSFHSFVLWWVFQAINNVVCFYRADRSAKCAVAVPSLPSAISWSLDKALVSHTMARSVQRASAVHFFVGSQCDWCAGCWFSRAAKLAAQVLHSRAVTEIAAAVAMRRRM